MGTSEEKEKQGILDDILNDEVDIETKVERNETESVSQRGKYQINSGEALENNDFYKIAARERTKMMLLVGPVACGKTTMETSIYQMFQRNPVQEYYFAGSQSLQGFEQRSYYTRIQSRGNTPETQRTRLDDTNIFLHLRLWNKKSEEVNNLILTDLSGESFANSIGQVEEIKKKYNFAERVDFIVGIIDGEKLCNKKTRNSVVAEIIELLRTFYDAEVLNCDCILQIVISKYDLLRELHNCEEVVKNVKFQISGCLSKIFPSIEYFKVAAMPENTRQTTIGYGLEEVLLSWLRKRNCGNFISNYESFEELSEFDRLYYKLLEKKNE
mgnify:CR=1 FL=1